MIENKYYIITIGASAIDFYLVHTIESAETVRTNNTIPNKFVVKLPIGSKITIILKNNTSYSHKEILKILSNDEWINNNLD